MALKSASYDAPAGLSSLLLVELNRDWSRERRALAATEIDLPLGTVLAVDEDGLLIPYPHAEAPGEGEAATVADAVAVLITPAEASADDQEVVVVERGVRVYAPGLFWLEDVTDEEKAQALLMLQAKTIAIQE